MSLIQQRPIFAALVLAALLAAFPDTAAAAGPRLRIGVVQMAQAPSIAGNRDRIVSGIAEAAQRGARVVVFPEAALMGQGSDDLAAVEAAVAAIRAAARERQVYVLFGATTHSPALRKNANWMLALAPDGRELLRYDKLYDHPKAEMPPVFEIDGVPCNAMICADRWLRGVEELPVQQGARISFELSCNSSVEWVPAFGWYWYVPRALRNSVWVVFANTGNLVSGVPPYPGGELRHGHSAIIAPDGRIVARSADDVAAVILAEIDVSEATRAEALARSSHPALRAFWAAGTKILAGEKVRVPDFAPLKSPATEITLAVAQTTGDVAAITAKIREARERQADLVAFPARAIPYAELGAVQDAARANRITVVVGAEYPAGGDVQPSTSATRQGSGAPRNSAFVIGPDGALLTRYDQLSARPPYERGSDPRTMWFLVKGVPAVVTVGHDGWWTELAELAALAGAQIHVHLDHDAAGGEAALLRRQFASNLASYLTFTACANVVDSAIWDDLRSYEERRAPIGRQLPESGAVAVYSQYSANLVTQATSAGELIVATRRVNPANIYHTRTIARKNPQMDAWFRFGAAHLFPSELAAKAKE